MSTAIINFTKNNESNELNLFEATDLTGATIGKEYLIKDIETDDADIKGFLYTLGCYSGEYITVISLLADNYIINVKDARYSVDKELAETIKI